MSNRRLISYKALPTLFDMQNCLSSERSEEILQYLKKLKRNHWKSKEESFENYYMELDVAKINQRIPGNNDVEHVFKFHTRNY